RVPAGGLRLGAGRARGPGEGPGHGRGGGPGRHRAGAVARARRARARRRLPAPGRGARVRRDDGRAAVPADVAARGPPAGRGDRHGGHGRVHRAGVRGAAARAAPARVPGIAVGDLATAFAMLADPTLVVVVLASAVYGLFIGAIPGLSATLATALLVPFVFFLDPLPAIAAVITMSAMAIFAGDLPSALVRMPGTPASAAYTEDAYLQTRAGHGARALGVALLGSVIGGVVGAVVLMVAAPLLAEFALQFTSYEYFWVAVLGLTASVIISAGSQVKGAISLLIGLLLATVGIDIALGYARFTFGSTD